MCVVICAEPAARCGLQKVPQVLRGREVGEVHGRNLVVFRFICYVSQQLLLAVFHFILL